MPTSTASSKKSEPTSGLEEYRELMVEFYAKTGFIYFRNGECKVSHALTPMGVLEEINAIIRGFYCASSGNYQSRIQPLKEALKKLNFIKQIRKGEDDEEK